jgi:hypothetical protein
MNKPNAIVRPLLACLLFGCAHAAPERTCRIVFLDRAADAPKRLHLFDGETSQEVELPSMNLSPVYKLAQGANRLKLLSAKAEDPEGVSPDAPSLEIPEDHTDLVLLVLSDPDNRIAPVRMEAVNLSDENFKIGRTLWMNRTDKAIEAKLGNQTLSLDPVSSKIVEAPLSEEGAAASGYYAATFTYQSEPDGAFEPITEQQWWHDANSRHLGFITNSGGRLPKIFYFRDFRVPAE